MLRLLIMILLTGMSRSVNVNNKVNVNCKYGYENYEDIKNINRCLVSSTDPVRHENMDVNVMNIQTTYGGQNIPSKIEGFEAEKTQIFFFPGKIGLHFPNLRVVKIQTSSLRKITSEDFKLMGNLEFLDLNNNLILILPANLFQYTQKLQIIWLKGNKIYYIHPTAFNGLNSLRSLDIYDNTCYTGGAKKLEDALTISNLSLCSNELLYSCGAFSNALNLISSSSSSYSQGFQMTNVISTQQTDIFGLFNNLNPNNSVNQFLTTFTSIERKFDEQLRNFKQLNQTCQNVHEKATSTFDAITTVKNQIINSFNDSIQNSIVKIVNNIIRSNAKHENSHANDSEELANTTCHCNSSFIEDKVNERMDIIEKLLNDLKHPELPYDSQFMIYVALLSCIIFLLIIILVILVKLCIRMPKNSTGYDFRMNQSNNENSVSYMARNPNRASENHYQMTNIACHQASIRDQHQTYQSEQQEYVEIPENSLNHSQIYYGSATRNNGDDFYEEQPNFNDTYSDCNGRETTENYATVYRPVNSGKMVNSEANKILYA